MKRLCVSVVAALFVLTAGAAQMNPNLYKDDICDRYELVHINGVNTDIFSAQANVIGLGEAFGNSHNGHQVFYALAYNQTDGLAADLRQSMAQLAATYPGSNYREWLGFVMNGIWPNSVPAQFFAEVTGSIAEFVTGMRRPTTTTNDPDIPLMMNALAQHHRSGRMVLLGHSQGSIYANILYNILVGAGYRWPGQAATSAAFSIPSTRLGLVSVAAAVTSVPGGSYVTSSNDAVIDAVRRIVPATLRHTTTIPYNPTVDDLGHNLRLTYLGQTVMNLPSARGKIVGLISAKFDTLRSKPNPGPFSSPAMITGYASWNNCEPGKSMYACVNGQVTGGQVYYGKVGSLLPPYAPATNLPIIRPGSYGEIAGLATAHASTCVSTLISNKIARINAGGPRSDAPNIPGCSNSYSSAFESWAWQIYSADGMTITPQAPPAPESYGYAEIREIARPFCKP